MTDTAIAPITLRHKVNNKVSRALLLLVKSVRHRVSRTYFQIIIFLIVHRTPRKVRFLTVYNNSIIKFAFHRAWNAKAFSMFLVILDKIKLKSQWKPYNNSLYNIHGTVNRHPRRCLHEGTFCANEKKTPRLPERDPDTFNISRI